MIKNFVTTMFVTALVMVILPSLVFADTSNTGSDYHVELLSNKYQKSDVTNYYHLQVGKEGLNSEIGLKLKNVIKQPIKLKVKMFDSYTSSNGSIDYRKGVSEQSDFNHLDPNYKLTKYLTEDYDIDLAVGETKTIKIPVNIPNLEGTILGGVAIERVDNKPESSDSNQFQLEVENNTVFAVQIDFDKVTKSDITFEKASIVPMSSNFAINLPVFFNGHRTGINSKLYYEVYDNKGNKLFSNSDLTRLDFAPSTSTNIKIPWRYNEISKAEDYKVKGYIMVNEDKESAKYPFDFKVKLELPNSSVGGAVDKIETALTGNGYNWLWLLLLLPLLYFLLRRKKYVLCDNSGEFLGLIYKDDEDYDNLVEYKKSNGKEYSYLHLYTKHKFKDENKEINYCYKYRKSIFNNNTTALEDKNISSKT